MNLSETLAIITLLGIIGVFLYSIYYIIDGFERRKQIKPKIILLLFAGNLFMWFIALNNMLQNPEMEFLPVIAKLGNLNIYIQGLFFFISIVLWLKDKALKSTHYRANKFYRE